MSRLNILKAFELEINKLDNDIEKPVTEDSLHWLNQGAVKFVKHRFNGNAPHYTSYELNEKRTRDLHNLVQRIRVSVASLAELMEMPWLTPYLVVDNDIKQISIDAYVYPADVMYVLNEDVVLGDDKGSPYMHTGVFECTLDNFMYRINNSLTDFHLKHKKARPLRVKVGKTSSGKQIVLLISDCKYSVEDLYLSYIKTPQKLTSEDPTTDVEYKDFEDDVWYEIIKIAAQMYVENQQEQRYSTITNEVLTQE